MADDSNSPSFGVGIEIDRVPFTAGDGMQLGLVHARGQIAPTRGPVLLVHGAGVRANIFNPPTARTLVQELVARGFDPWLVNWRASTEVAANEWDLDKAAVHDHPAAVRTICERTGARSIQAVIHCQGSTSFTMSALAGLVPQVRTIVSNAVSLHTVIPPNARRKLLWLTPLLRPVTRYLDPRWGEAPHGLTARALAMLVRIFHRECSNGVCRFASFTYGAGHPTLWPHDNISAATHDWIRGEFAAVPLTFFRQMAACVRRGNLVSTGAFPALPADFGAQPPQTDARFVLFAGRRNECFVAESQENTFAWLERHAKGRHALHVLDGYGHLDVFLGDRAATEVFPRIIHELERDGSSS